MSTARSWSILLARPLLSSVDENDAQDTRFWKCFDDAKIAFDLALGGWIQGAFDKAAQLCQEAAIESIAPKTAKALADRGLDKPDFLGAAGQIKSVAEGLQGVQNAARVLCEYSPADNKFVDPAGSGELGGERGWERSLNGVADLAKAYVGAIESVASILGAFPATAFAGQNLQLLATLLSDIVKIVDDIKFDFNKAVTHFEKAQENFTAAVNVAGYSDERRGNDDAPSNGGNGGAGGSSNATPQEKPADPMVLDLDGDGIELTEISAPPVYFDAEGDQTAILTAWVDPDDGFLARDLDGNGKIETQAELIGSDEILAFDDLAQSDGNQDGRITQSDDIWASLVVWRDLNQNGTTETGELEDMATAGIASVSLG
ncbi:MAG: hypothetical protein AB3N13_07195, partial [Arenibacterium sp.]